jgi:uncharacterized membrane protein
MMFPFGFIVGAVAGAAGAVMFGRQIAEHGRPLAKVALKATLAAMHDARVRGAEIGEAAEDLFAEAKSEVSAEIFEAAMAAAKAKAAEMAKAANGPSSQGSDQEPSVKSAAARAAVKRSRIGSTND